MIIYRLSSGLYKNDLSGTGARLYGGRWNSKGIRAVYLSEHISLSLLELMVHINRYTIPADYHLITIEIPDKFIPFSISATKLKKGWKDDLTYTQFIGDGFLNNSQSLILKIPSVVVEQEHNYILNPAHPDVNRIKIISTALFDFDKRLYLKKE